MYIDTYRACLITYFTLEISTNNSYAMQVADSYKYLNKKKFMASLSESFLFNSFMLEKMLPSANKKHRGSVVSKLWLSHL